MKKSLTITLLFSLIISWNINCILEYVPLWEKISEINNFIFANNPNRIVFSALLSILSFCFVYFGLKIVISTDFDYRFSKIFSSIHSSEYRNKNLENNFCKINDIRKEKSYCYIKPNININEIELLLKRNYYKLSFIIDEIQSNIELLNKLEYQNYTHFYLKRLLKSSDNLKNEFANIIKDKNLDSGLVKKCFNEFDKFEYLLMKKVHKGEQIRKNRAINFDAGYKILSNVGGFNVNKFLLSFTFFVIFSSDLNCVRIPFWNKIIKNKNEKTENKKIKRNIEIKVDSYDLKLLVGIVLHAIYVPIIGFLFYKIYNIRHQLGINRTNGLNVDKLATKLSNIENDVNGLLSKIARNSLTTANILKTAGLASINEKGCIVPENNCLNKLNGLINNKTVK